MLAITFLPALGFTIGGIILGIYGAYLLIGWALSEETEKVQYGTYDEFLPKIFD